MNTTENLISTGCTATAPQPINQIIKPVKFPAQPQEWKIISLRECPTPENMQQCEHPIKQPPNLNEDFSLKHESSAAIIHKVTRRFSKRGLNERFINHQLKTVWQSNCPGQSKRALI